MVKNKLSAYTERIKKKVRCAKSSAEMRWRMTFSQKLKALRKEHSFSQEEIAQQLNVSRQSVSKWESGQGFPETDKLKQISTIFGVTLDYLLKDDYDVEEQPDLGYYVSREMIDGFLSYKRHGAKRITIGVCFIILSNLFNNIFNYNQTAQILYWVSIAVGISVLIWNGFQPKRYREIGTKQLCFDDATIKAFREEQEKNSKQYAVMIIAGVILLVLGPQFTQIVMNYSDNMGDSLTWILLATCVSLFILAGLSLHAENMIAQNAVYMEKKNKKGAFRWIYVALPVTAIAVIIGIVTNAWSPVMPIIALFCILLVAVCKLLLEGRGSNE